MCVVEVRIESELAALGEGTDLFDALVAARRILEKQETLLGCNGSRREVFPSSMLRQATKGQRAYVLTMPRTSEKPPTVDIFDPAPNLTGVVTVDEQKAWFECWLP